MNIFNILDSKFDLSEKIKNLSKLLLEKNFFVYNGYYTSFENFFDLIYFRKWNYSYGCYNLKEFREKLELNYSYDYSNNNDLYFCIEDEISAINFLQYAYNVTRFVKECLYNDIEYSITKDINDFYEIFDIQFNYILSKMNHRIIKHPKENYYLLVPCNDKTTRCAELQQKFDVSFLLYEYTSLLIVNNVEKKREILKLLANELEPIINDNLKIYNSGPVHDIFFELNSCLNNFNIRHNNSDPRRIKYFHELLNSFSQQDYLNVYDMTYDLILNAILINNYQSITKQTYLKYKKKAGLEKTDK